ncbi:MAG: response regulator [Alphaproteobacteria bacterium]|nr:response regulator [Alphaproteobacteria bacterium]
MANILIIDDDPQMRRLVTLILNDAGHSVRQAPGGQAGIEKVRQAQPDLVITDLVMPDKEGIETIRELHHEFPDIPILAISGGTPDVYLRAARELGAQASLAKPFGADELAEIVNELIARAAGTGKSVPS